MLLSIFVRARRTAVIFSGLLLLVSAAPAAHAGGPKYVAGTAFFNPAVLGQPIHWAGGLNGYYVDRGPLNSSVSNQQATAMVDAAAALWSAIPTAAVTLTDRGPLNEDVSGANICRSTSGPITAPADVTPAATSYPLGVIYDADGSVIDAIFGTGASQPTSCQNNGVWMWMDNINPDATIAHGIILLNGLCATNSNSVADDELRAGARLRPDAQPGLRAGEPRGADRRAARRRRGLAGDAAFERRLRLGRRGVHPRPQRAALRRHRRAEPHLSQSPHRISPISPASS